MLHKVTDQEISNVKKLGFQVTEGQVSFPDFINEYFPGFVIGGDLDENAFNW